MEKNKELIFVYNANSGKWNAYLDTLHKIVSPKTYPCSLCAITYGNWGIREEWATYIKTLPLALRFLHKDEWQRENENQEPLPAIFLKEGDKISTFLKADKMNTFSLEELKEFISKEMSLLLSN